MCPVMEHNFMKQHVSDITFMGKGHMNQEGQGFQLTKQQSTSILKEDQKETTDNMTNLKKYASIIQKLETKS